MPVCARAVQQADGTLALVLDPTATDLTACAYVVETGAELGSTLLSLSPSDGSLLGVGVVSCWAAAYGIRSVINVIRGSENEAG